jgi:hypothetical protein
MLYESPNALYGICLMIWPSKLVRLGFSWIFRIPWISRNGFAWFCGLELLGFPWILSSESSVFNGLQAFSAGFFRGASAGTQPSPSCHLSMRFESAAGSVRGAHEAQYSRGSGFQQDFAIDRFCHLQRLL